MKNFLITIILLLGTNSIYSQQTYTLEKAIEYAVNNNNNIKLKELEMIDADQQINEFKAIGLPQINFNVDYTYNMQIASQPTQDFLTPFVAAKLLEWDVVEQPINTGEPEIFDFSFGSKNVLGASIDLNTMLFDASWLYGLKAAKAFKDQVASEVETSKYFIKANVIRSYLNILIAQENLKTIQKNITNLSNSLRETSLVYQNGFAEQLDVDRLQLSLENLKIQKSNIERAIELSYNGLKYAMGFPLEKQIIVEDNLDLLASKILAQEQNYKESIDYSKRPEYKTIEKGEALNDLDLKRLRAGYFPMLRGFASYSQNLQRNSLFEGAEPGFFPASRVGLKMIVPVFDGFSKKSSIQRTKIRIERTSIQKEEFERSVSLEITNAKINFQNTKQSVASSRNSLKIAEDIYKKAEIKYKEGVGSSVELNQAEASLFQAQANLTASLYNLIVAKAEWEIAEGNI
jgi:outer membrane protein TolC